MRIRSFIPRFLVDGRGVAATEFALIAPALIFLVMGVFELSFRFRAAEEATRYVHQVADLISRETTLTTGGLEEIRDASIFMMNPLDTTGRVWAITVIVAGFATFVYAASVLSAVFVSGEFTSAVKARREERMREQLQGHVIVVGFGRVGRAVVKGVLNERRQCIVIDRELGIGMVPHPQ